MRKTIITQPIVNVVTNTCFTKGWSKWNGQCYLLVGGEVSDDRKDQATAASTCRSMENTDSRSHLVSIHSVKECIHQTNIS